MGDVAEIGVVYRITCAANGRAYIGSTSNFYARRRGHLYLLRKGTHHSLHLQRAYLAHGESAFVFETIESGIAVSDLLERESAHIASEKPVFNGSLVSATRRGSKQSDECKAKVSSANKGRIRSVKTRALIGFSLLGNKRAAGNRNNRKVTPKIKTEIYRLVAAGWGSYRIGHAVGLSKKTIINVRHKRHNYG